MPPRTRQAASAASKSPTAEEEVRMDTEQQDGSVVVTPPNEGVASGSGSGKVEVLASPSTSTKPARPARKRGREGSSEPGSLVTTGVAASTSAHHLASKKNRVVADPAPGSEEDTASVPGGTHTKEAGNVGEVRKKVAKMTWKEGKGPVEGEEGMEDDVMSVKSSGTEKEPGGDVDVAEAIEEDEVEADGGSMNSCEQDVNGSGEAVADQQMDAASEPPTSAKSLKDQPMHDQVDGAQEDSGDGPLSATTMASESAQQDAQATAMHEDTEDGSVEAGAGAGTGEAEAGRKRKLVERNSSSAIRTETEADKKRLKEDVDGEASEQSKADAPTLAVPSAESAQAKPTTAPAPAAATPAPKKTQPTFGSFSSSASPFAAVKSTSAFGSQSAPSSSASPFASVSKTSAFGGAASGSTAASASPFKPLNKAFGGWAATASPFGTPVKPKPAATEDAKADAAETKKADDKEDSGSASGSFGDILASDKGNEADADERKRLDVQEKEHRTGEEEDDTVYQVRCKLFVMEGNGGWKERGTGPLHLNVRRSDGKFPRLVMRAEGVLRLILNVALFSGMKTEISGDRYVKATMVEDGQLQSFLIRLGSAKAATELQERILDYIPYEAGKSARLSESQSPGAAQGDGEADGQEDAGDQV